MNTGATHLFMASQSGHLEVVQALLAAGASKDQAMGDGAMPLFMASQLCHLEVVQALLAAGASKDQAVNTVATPLFVASQNGQLEVVQALLAAGASRDQAKNDGATPLSRVSCYGHLRLSRRCSPLELRRIKSDKDVRHNDASHWSHTLPFTEFHSGACTISRQRRAQLHTHPLVLAFGVHAFTACRVITFVVFTALPCPCMCSAHGTAVQSRIHGMPCQHPCAFTAWPCPCICSAHSTP